MSRIGKQEINIPEGVEAKWDQEVLLIKGPKGELQRMIPKKIGLEIGETIKLKCEDSAFWGLYRSLIFNMVSGVSQGFEKRLQIVGVGYKAEVKENKLIMGLGYSHSVIMEIPQGLSVKVEGDIIAVSGINKELVGQFSANIKKQRKPDPYKGKGIRYEGEFIKLKPGKKAGTEA